MNAVKNDIEKLVEKELAAADEKFPQFNSPHEGYAVILEEMDELKGEIEYCNILMTEIWRNIKINERCLSIIRSLRVKAIEASCEAIQVAAMCDKFIRLWKTEEKSKPINIPQNADKVYCKDCAYLNTDVIKTVLLPSKYEYQRP